MNDLPTDTTGDRSELQPSDTPLLHAGRMSHPDYGYNPIKLPNLNDIIVTSIEADGITRKPSK